MKVYVILVSFTVISFLARETLYAQNLPSYNQEVLDLMNAYPESQGYDIEWSGSGTDEAIEFAGYLILGASKKTYCTGVTLNVAMKILQKYQLISHLTYYQARQFQQEWYCAVGSAGEEKGAITALLNAGVGKEVSFEDAKTGDFIQFWRASPTLSGHSAVFKEWVKEDGKIVGIRYRGSQRSTDGVGDKVEFFDRVVPEEEYPINREKVYFGRIGN